MEATTCQNGSEIVFSGMPDGYAQAIQEHADIRFKGDLALAICDLIDRALVIQPMLEVMSSRIGALEKNEAPKEEKPKGRMMIDGVRR